MKDAGSPPQAPDPNVTIPLQTAANKDMFDYALTAQRANSVSPQGTQSWLSTPGEFNQAAYQEALKKWEAAPGQSAKPIEANFQNPATWTYETKLSPEQQQLYDRGIQSQLQQSQLLDALTGRVAQATQNPLDLSGAPALQSSVGQGAISQTDVGDFLKGLAGRSLGDNYNQTVSDAAYNKQTNYLDPQISQQRQALEARLAEQGFVPGTPGYNQAMQNFMDTNARAYSDARNSSILQGYGQGNTQIGLQSQIAALLGNAQNAQFGQNQQNAQFGNASRAQAIAEALQQRNYPLNELNAIRTGTQVQTPSNPATYSTPGLAAPDVMGAYGQKYQGDLGAYNAEVSSDNALTSGLFSLGGAALLGGGNLFSGLGSGLFGSSPMPPWNWKP